MNQQSLDNISPEEILHRAASILMNAEVSARRPDNAPAPEEARDYEPVSQGRPIVHNRPARHTCHGRCRNDLRAGLCEVRGLVHRARQEVLSDNSRHALITLGRLADILDTELNK